MHPDSSLVYSPVSLSAALSTLYFGAKGETKELMESVLGFQVSSIHALYTLILIAHQPQQNGFLNHKTVGIDTIVLVPALTARMHADLIWTSSSLCVALGVFV